MKSTIFPFAEEIRVDTRDRVGWLAQRQLGIGGSDAAVIMGASKWKQPYALWKEKREGAIEVDNDALFWGRQLESAVRDGFGQKSGLAVSSLYSSVFVHPYLKFARGSLDGFVSREDGSPFEIYEGKTSSVPDEWGESGTDNYPEQYLWQIQHYLAVTGAPLAHLAVLLFGRDFRTYVVPRDKTLIDELLSREGVFWKSVLDGTPPEIDPAGVEALDLIRHRYPRMDATITLSQQALEVALAWDAAKKDVKTGEKRVDQLRAELELMLKGHTIAAFEGDAEGRQLIVSESFRTVYDVPEDIKSQYASKSDKPIVRLDFKVPKQAKGKANPTTPKEISA